MTSSKKKDYYKILEIGKEAPKKLVEQAYRELVEIYNFDSQGTYSLLEEDERKILLEDIREAYEVLSDDLRRKQYDENVYVLSDYKNFKGNGSEKKFSGSGFFADVKISRQSEELKKKTQEMFQNIDPSDINGNFLKKIREKAQITAKELSEIIKLTVRAIDLLESDNFADMPSRTYVQGHIKLYLKCFTDNFEQIVKSYMTNYDEFMKLRRQKN